MNYRAVLQELTKNRDGWLQILIRNPDNLEAAQFIVVINSQIRLIESSRRMDGDYDADV